MQSLELLITIALGIVLLLAGIAVFFRQRVLLAQSLRAEGIVTELVGKRARQEYVITRTAERMQINPKILYRPKIRFRTANGQTIEFVVRVASRPPRYTVGERVNVLYHPNQPSKAFIPGFFQLWFVALMLVGCGVCTTGMGLLMWVLFAA